MTHSIIVDGLAKQYQLGQRHRATMLQERLVNLVKHPFRKQTKGEVIWALKDVSFTVDEGEVIGLIGRNGAGKSTLLKVLSRITYPTSGKMETRGRVASLLEVGTGFHEELTGRENIYLNGSILGMTKKEINAQLDAIIAFAGVEKFIDTPIKRYSSGMRLRLGFAVAAHLDPDILLVDEVLAVGDVEFQKKCLRAMDDLRRSGRTVLFVSHNMAAVENLCPRAIWIDGGQVRQDGEGREVIKAYLSSFADAHGAGFDLSQVASRGGSGAIEYTKIEFMNADGRPETLFRSGGDLNVRLHFHAKERVSFPHFGVKIYTDLGTLITTVSTWNVGFEIPVLNVGSGYIDLTIDSLNLMPARYNVSLWIASAGNVWYDVVEQCAVIDVEASDFYGSGRGLDSSLGIIFFPCKWAYDSSPHALHSD